MFISHRNDPPEPPENLLQYQDKQYYPCQPKLWNQGKIQRVSWSPAMQFDRFNTIVGLSHLVCMDSPWEILGADSENRVIQKHFPAIPPEFKAALARAVAVIRN